MEQGAASLYAASVHDLLRRTGDYLKGYPSLQNPKRSERAKAVWIGNNVINSVKRGLCVRQNG